MKKKILLSTGEKIDVSKETSRYYICKDRCVKKNGSLFVKEICIEEKKKDKKEED